MSGKIKSHFLIELNKGIALYNDGQFTESYRFFERAHILGQKYIIEHTISHVWMLKVGLKTKSIKEVIGQLIRIPFGVVGSAVGIVPVGNTGGSNVSAFKSMKIPNDLKHILENDDLQQL